MGAPRRLLLPTEDLGRLIDILRPVLAEAELRQLDVLGRNPAYRLGTLHRLRSRVRAEFGFDPSEGWPALPPPRLGDLPPGELDGPLLLRPAAGDHALRIPAATLVPVAAFLGRVRSGKSRATYWLASQLAAAGVAVVAFEPLPGGWQRAAAALGPERAVVLRADRLPLNPLEPDDETEESALGRLCDVLKAEWTSVGATSALRTLVEAERDARGARGESGPVCLDDVHARLRTAPKRAFGRAAEYAEVLASRFVNLRGQLPLAFSTRRGVPRCELVRPGRLLVLETGALSDQGEAFFARLIDSVIARHLAAHGAGCGPARPGFPRVVEVLEEASGHVLAGASVEGSYWPAQVRVARHTQRSLWLVDQTCEWHPAIWQGVGFLLGFECAATRSRAALADWLRLSYDQRDALFGSLKPREALLSYTGAPPMSVRVPELAPLPEDESAVRAASEATVSAWTAACEFWRPAAAAWEDVVGRMERRHAEQQRGERSALADLAPELRERLLRFLARAGSVLELHGERANALSISLDEEHRLCRLAEKHGYARTEDDRIGKAYELLVLTDAGRTLVQSRGARARFVACGKEGWVHRFIADRVARVVCEEAPGTEVLRTHTAYGPPGDQVQPDLVLLVRANRPDGPPDLRIAANVQCSGNGEREGNCAVRLARIAEITHVLLVARNSRMALQTARLLKRLLRDDPIVHEKLRVTDAGKVIQGPGLLAFIVAEDDADA